MTFIKDAIAEAIKSTRCEVRQLEQFESISIRCRIEKMYTFSKGQAPLWERLKDDASKYDPDGWKIIGEYPYQNEVTIFFDKKSEATMYLINRCSDVAKLISECPGFVFYVTNSNCNFLLCHNDHDYLIGAGEAKKWIENLYFFGKPAR